ncbi:MAG: VTT domain-containing protein [Myxococcales bacterium]|nr:VTT domain-containing protein [Myxococcales bacterium]
MPDALLEWLSNYAADPVLGALALALATLILEDAATVAGALLAAEGVIAPGAALLGLYVGIVAGDLGLYGLGRLAASYAWARRLVGEDNIEKGRAYLDRTLWVTLFSARSIPGMRLPTYTASGFLRVAFHRFALIAIVAAALWTTVFFVVVLRLGEAAAARLSGWSWVFGLALISVVLVLPRVIRAVIRRRDAADDERPNAVE